MTVTFWSFSKRQNSTLRPSSAASASFNCVLKDASGVLRPVLEIYNSAAWNPSQLNYAYIADYQRYYYVTEWTYNTGVWECSLQCDAMASHKTEIGQEFKYVLRAASVYDPDVVDTIYPSIASQPNVFADTESFGYAQDFIYGQYIIGLANRDSVGTGAVTYYSVTASQIRSLVQYMFVQVSDLWTQGFTGMTDVLYRCLYDPFSYIKSCMWFPLTQAGVTQSTLKFGNYDSGITAMILSRDASSWNTPNHVLSLPSDWTTRQARSRTNPACHMYLRLNPFGVIELNPADLAGATGVHVKVIPDYISGEALMEVRARYGTSNGALLAQKVARIGVDINLSSSSINAGGLLSGALGIASGVAAIATGGTSAIAGGIISAIGGVGSVAESAIPTMGNSTGQTAGGIALMDGVATLQVITQNFPAERPLELGRPLLQNKTLSTLSGFIKCADGEISIAGYPDEITEISTHLVNGFFYE